MKTIKRKSGIARAFLTEFLLAVRTRAQTFKVFDVKQHCTLGWSHWAFTPNVIWDVPGGPQRSLGGPLNDIQLY
eukprot:176830-Prymnesium_polylepis.1